MSRIDFPKIYNPANQTPQELIENFVVRTKLFRQIFKDIKNSEMKFPEQHYIIQGIRGQGKSTLLLRIAYEINKDNQLSKRIIPIIFNEEQYNISRLYKLWETTAEYLEDYDEIAGLYNEMQKIQFDDDYEYRCFQLLEKALKKNNKKIILFIDNIDEIFNKFSKKEHHRLREVFIESAELRLIGASSVSLEFHYDYGKPFYQFFRMPQLKGLTSDETKTLLLKLGEQYKRERVKEIVKHQPGRVEALRRITGGVIRTIVILFEIFVDDKDGHAFRGLEKILDIVSPLYKHRMDKLSSQQQEIVDFIALSWDAVSTKEISQRTKMKSKAVSAQLKQLDKYHIIEKEKTDTKNNLYRIHERFFNIWYLMRLGRKEDEKRVRFLVEFLQIWCDERELEKRTLKHLESLKRGQMYEQQAFYMTEALARTTIAAELQHRLIVETRQYLDLHHSELQNYLSQSDQELQSDAYKALSSQDLKSAMVSIEKVKNKTPEDLNLLGLGYLFVKKQPKKAEEYLKLAAENEHPGAMNNLALMYQTEFKDFKKAEKFYLMAVEKEDPGAMNNLALMYKTEFKDFKKAEKFYLMAVEKEHPGAMNNLAWMYFQQKRNKLKALKYAKNAYQSENTIINAHTFSMILLWNNDIKKATEISKVFLEDNKFYSEFPENVSQYLMMLMAKKQYQLTRKIFNENQHNLKDRFKPIYYALMYFMRGEYPNEYRKMGGELKKTVEEIILKIEQMAVDYK